MIPLTRPVIGDDLVNLKDRFGINAADSCWLYACTMTKWSSLTGQKKTDARPIPGAKSAVPDPTLAIMVRVLDVYPEAIPLPPAGPSAAEVFELVNQVRPTARKAFVVMFGCEESSGYRWIVAGRKVGPSLNRLFLIFTTLLNEARAQSEGEAMRFLDDWDEMVRDEGRRRGIVNVFQEGRWAVDDPSLIDTKNRPVRGEDLDLLRERLGLNTQDACWLFGMPINRWMVVAKKPGEIRVMNGESRYQPGTKDPVSAATLALMVRILRKRPDACPIPSPIPAEEVFNTLLRIRPEIDKKRFSVLFGSEASSGYRWLKRGVISAPVSRLFRVFMTIVEPQLRVSPAKASKLLVQWESIVVTEGKARGIDNIFKVGRWTNPEGTAAKEQAKADAADERRRKKLATEQARAAGRAKKKDVDPETAEAQAAAKTIARATRTPVAA